MATSNLPLLIDPLDLRDRLAGAALPSLCIVDLSSEENYLAGHIPGAVYLPYRALLSGQPPAPGRLPPLAQLQATFDALGHSPDTHYVVCDDEGGGWAGRFIWTLDVIGHKHYSYLDGGMLAWRAEGLPLETGVNPPRAAAVPTPLSLHREPVAEIDDILAGLERPGFVVWDARSPAEYRGERVLAHKAGHIPGAINCEWKNLMDPTRGYRLRRDAKQLLLAMGVTEKSEIVTHCHSHHRSAFAYLVGKILGLNIRGYHGSWSEWGNHPSTPVEV